MPFLSDLVTRDLPGREFELVEPLCYQSRYVEITVPAGETTDFASIPGALNWLIPKHGNFDRAAVVHDYLYMRRPPLRTSAARGTWRLEATETAAQPTRKTADVVMLEAMKADGVRLPQRWAIYLGVRLGGWVVWGKRWGLFK